LLINQGERVEISSVFGKVLGMHQVLLLDIILRRLVSDIVWKVVLNVIPRLLVLHFLDHLVEGVDLKVVVEFLLCLDPEQASKVKLFEQHVSVDD